ncbi:MAG: DNA polymerase III subunit gamma/tau [Elusimicrobiaceae bacterium]|nr:DNA polymerase III subunit gamma/tau [Elusimicrobiaceae bacterium]
MSENTPYVSLANKYRPQKFEDMVGQESISKTLQNALKLGRIGHAYLFYGPRGCGKTTTARILAKALNCTGHGQDKPTAVPCGECPQCREIAQSADLDVLELDAASNTQVEKVREAIIDTVALAASRDRYKVFILDEVHMLSDSSFNALLKTIEEPPAHVVFILATTEKHKVPATIVSRCQTFRFRPITTEEISNHLMDLAEAEGLDLTEKAARLLAKNAGGALRDGLTLLDRAIAYSDGKIDEKLVGEMLGLTPQDLLSQALMALVQKDTASLHSVFESLQAEGFDANSFLKDIKNALGDLFYFALNQGAVPFEGAEKITAIASPGLLAGLSRKINKLAEEVKFSDNALVSAEVGLFTVMESCFDVEGFIRRLEALERGEGGSALPPSSTPTKSAAKSAQISKPTEPRVQAVANKPIQKETVMAENRKATSVKTAPQSVAAPVNCTDDRSLWENLVQAFKPSVFVYDALTNCSVHFGPDQWTIHFGKGKEFYKVPASTKLPELEKMAYKLSGRNIRFSITVAEQTVPAADTTAKKQTRAANQAAAPTASADTITAEEPFVKADFSAEVEAISDEKTPEELKDILDIIGGEVLA